VQPIVFLFWGWFEWVDGSICCGGEAVGWWGAEEEEIGGLWKGMREVKEVLDGRIQGEGLGQW